MTGEDADNMDEDITFEDEELELKCSRAQMKEDPTHEVDTSLKVQAMIPAEMET